MTEEQLANSVFQIERKLAPEEANLIHTLWLDWGYLLLRCKIIAEGLESQSNPPMEVAEWAREAYEGVMSRMRLGQLG